jgi:ribosomal protein L17
MDTIDMKGFSPAQKAEYEAMLAELAHEEERLATLAEEKAAAAVSPSTILAAKREEIQAKRAVREKLERDANDELAFEELASKFGKHRVARIRTVEGAIILRPMTDVEIDVTSIKARAMETDAQKTKVHKAALLGTVAHPSKERVEKLLADYPGLWGDLYQARDAIISGLDEERVKKG